MECFWSAELFSGRGEQVFLVLAAATSTEQFVSDSVAVCGFLKLYSLPHQPLITLRSVVDLPVTEYTLGLGFVGEKCIRIFGHGSIRIFEYLQLRDIIVYKK